MTIFQSQPAARTKWLILALIFIIALPALWISLTAAPKMRVDVGARGDETYLTGVNEPESSSTENYRWTGAESTLRMPNLSSRYQELRLHAHGWRPAGIASPTVQIKVPGQPPIVMQTTRDLRTYHILLPRDDSSFTTEVDFISQLLPSTSDNREIGFGLDWLELDAIDQSSGPTWWQFGGQALLLALIIAVIGALALPRGWSTPAAAIAAIAIVGANMTQPLWVSTALSIWLLITAALLLATWLLAPHLKRVLAPWMSPRYATIAWALLVAALALRLLGETHPLFEMHDIGFHHIWIDTVTQGNLYIFSAPSEFQNRSTFNPPAGYVLLMPLRLLFSDQRLTIQIGIALADALGCLFLLLLARELGLRARAALIALALYIALPINMTMLWWGFATNDIAQTTGLMLILLLLRLVQRPSAPALAAFVITCMICLLMHVGALVLIIGLVCAALVFGWWQLSAATRKATVGGLALALAVTLLIYFTAVVDPVLARTPSTAAPNLATAIANSWADRFGKLDRVLDALTLGFLPLPIVLAPLGFVQLLRARTRPALVVPLLVGWLLVCLAFLGVYFGLGLLVRYLYFGAPLICLGLGVLLHALWQRRGRALVLALVLFVAWSGLALWAAGVLVGIKPSLLPLTH